MKLQPNPKKQNFSRIAAFFKLIKNIHFDLFGISKDSIKHSIHAPSIVISLLIAGSVAFIGLPTLLLIVSFLTSGICTWFRE